MFTAYKTVGIQQNQFSLKLNILIETFSTPMQNSLFYSACCFDNKIFSGSAVLNARILIIK